MPRMYTIILHCFHQLSKIYFLEIHHCKKYCFHKKEKRIDTLLIGKHKLPKINKGNFFKHVLLERMEETVGRIVLPNAMIVYVTVSTDLVFAKTERKDIQTAMKASDTGSTET